VKIEPGRPGKKPAPAIKHLRYQSVAELTGLIALAIRQGSSPSRRLPGERRRAGPLSPHHDRTMDGARAQTTTGIA
jgi:hypothetical protein